MEAKLMMLTRREGIMRHGEVPIACDKAGRRIEFSELLWTSADTCWSGFRLEMHRLRESARFLELNAGCTQIGMCVSGVSKMEIQAGRTEQRSISTAGAIVLSDRGFEYKSFSWFGSTDVLMVELDMAQIEATTARDSFPPDLSPAHQFLMRDPHLAALLSNMISEVKNGCGAGKIFGQSTSLALASYILGRYAIAATNEKELSAGLSSNQLRTVRDYVRAHLSDDISLYDLAALLKLSAQHFSRLFKKSLDVTPYQYVLRERVDESLNLLVLDRMSLSEIAQAMGFADQSHFTTVFKKVTKTTPKQYQLSVRSRQR